MTSLPSKRSGAVPRARSPKLAALDRWAKDGLAQMNEGAERAVRAHWQAGRDVPVRRDEKIRPLKAGARRAGSKNSA